MPDAERMTKFLQVLEGLGISIKADLSNLKPKVVQKIVEELKQYPEFRVLSSKLLSCMDKAIYSPENIGHWALASKIYTHFTSPIRRYPDLMVHRMLHNYFFSKDGISEKNIEHFKEILGDIGIHSSEMERNSDECERDVEEMKMAEYMESHIGEEYSGMISSVMNYGFFVQLDNLIEGLVPIATLNGFYYNQSTDTIISERNKTVYIVGKEVNVRVVRASKEERIIDFELVGEKDGKEEKED